MPARNDSEPFAQQEAPYYGSADTSHEQLFRSPSHDPDLQRVKPQVLRRKLMERQAFSAVFCLVVACGLLTASYLANSLVVLVYAVHFLTSVASYLIALVGLCTADSSNFSFFFSVRAQRRTTLGHVVALIFQVIACITIIAMAVHRSATMVHRDAPPPVRLQLLIEVSVVGAIITCIKMFVLDRALIDNVDGGVDDVAADGATAPPRPAAGGSATDTARRGVVELDWGTLRSLRAALFRVVSEDAAWCAVVAVTAAAAYGFPLDYADAAAAVLLCIGFAVVAAPILFENVRFLYSSLSAYYLPRERVHLALMRVPGVAAVTSADVYGVSSNTCAVACHIEAGPGVDPTELARAVDVALYQDLNVVATTVQVAAPASSRAVGLELSFGYGE